MIKLNNISQELVNEVLSRGGAIELFGQAKYLGQGIKDMTKAYKKKDWAQMEEEVDYIVTKAKLMGDIVNQKRYQESVNEARTINVEPNWEGMWRFFKQMAKTNPSDWKKMQRTMGSEWLKIDKMAQQKGWKSESVNEGRKGPGAYINTFEKLLRKQMGKDYDKKAPSEKDIERVMGLMRKRYGEPNMYEKRHTESTDEVNIKKQLLKKFGKDPLYKDVIMAKNPKEMKKTMATLKSIRGGNALTLMRKYVQKLMEISESGIMYRAGVKRYGKEGMTKIQSAAGSGAGHAEIGKIKDKYDKKRKKKESVNEAGTKSIDGEELLKYLQKRFKMSRKQAIASMKKHNMDVSSIKKESVNEATGVHIKLVDSITRLILSGRDDKIAYDRLKMILKQRDSLISGKESSGVYNLIYKELFNGIYSAIGKVRKKYKLESVNEADLGLTLKKGKTVKVTHKTSGKELIIVDKPNVRKEYEKIGFYVEGKVNEAVEPKGNMAKIFKIVKDKQYAKISGTIVDLFSASALVKIFDALNDSNKEKLNKMNMNKLSFILSKAFKDKVVV